MVDQLVADIPDARKGYWLLFSASPFSGCQRKLTRLRQELSGWWYAVRMRNFRFYFPLATCILLSLLLTGIVWLVRYFSR